MRGNQGRTLRRNSLNLGGLGSEVKKIYGGVRLGVNWVVYCEAMIDLSHRTVVGD